MMNAQAKAVVLKLSVLLLAPNVAGAGPPEKPTCQAATTAVKSPSATSSADPV
jgi:hypothetical protein